MRTAHDASGLPVVAYPNSGEAWVDRAWNGAADGPSAFAAAAEGLAAIPEGFVVVGDGPIIGQEQ